MRSSYIVRRPIRNSYLVRQQDRRLRKELGLVLAAVLPVAIGLLGYVWINLQLVHIGYEVHRLEKSLELEQRRNRELLLESAYLTSPERIRARASEELGMMPVSLDRLVFLEEVQ